MTFPRIQGADACGYIEAVGEGVDPARIGEQVLVQTIQPRREAEPFSCITVGSECDGGFAPFTVAKSEFTHAINCDWTDAELASVPCRLFDGGKHAASRVCWGRARAGDRCLGRRRLGRGSVV
nr:alcohol dehydrogenase catalytic domain-containing protein [Ruegeria atlantica]